MAIKKLPANIVGPEIRRRRVELGLTQELLVIKSQLAGLDISRGTLSHIESQIRYVTDEELWAFASVFDVSTDGLYPSDSKKKKALRKAT